MPRQLCPLLDLGTLHYDLKHVNRVLVSLRSSITLR